MKTTRNIIYLILLISFSLSNNLDFGYSFRYYNDDNIYILLSGQLNDYKSNNFYQSHKIDFITKFDICFGNCEYDTGIGLSSSYGKYHRYKFLQLSYGLGLGCDYVKNKIMIYSPFDSEISIIIKEKIGLSFEGMIYPFLDHQTKKGGLGIGWGLNLKILNI